MFETILIANRGEIACRVIRTCRRMGVRAVGVYSEADAGAMFVERSDEAYRIGGAQVRESYLRGDRVIETALKSRAQAIHPGFGFLAENAAFAQACADAGLVFIGPSPESIRLMGDKREAKLLMERSGVPVVPGFSGEDQDDARLLDEARRIGFPLLIKAVMGGGGKGMRVVRSAEEFADALEGARRESLSAFGDDRVLLERYLEEPRHVEMQVFGDTHGNLVHLYERDCSVQRRHQKVIEESPAPGLTEPARAAMADAALRAARAVNYVGAGTVEFIRSREDEFFFLEMNTRLQVEHPVTEMVTGFDLVEWQLRVAAGEPLPATQDQIRRRGHAIEARVYAEDPRSEFLPSTGTLRHFRPPAPSAHVRFDTGVQEGDRVDVFYDPMIAKLVVWDADRDAALRRLRLALANTRVAGVTTNLTFLSGIAAHPAFRDGRVHTGFLDTHRDALFPSTRQAGHHILALASLFVLQRRAQIAEENARQSGDPFSPWHLTTGWRLNEQYEYTLRFLDWGREVTVPIRFTGDHYVAQFADESIIMSGEFDASGDLLADLSGARMSVTAVQNGHEITVITAGSTHRLILHDPLAVEEETGSTGDRVCAPMPGRVLKVYVREGETVDRGAPLMVIEAMKMEHTVRANTGGLVSRVYFEAGDQVTEDAVLLDLESAEEEG